MQPGDSPAPCLSLPTKLQVQLELPDLLLACRDACAQLEKAGMTPGLRAMGDKLYSLDELEVSSFSLRAVPVVSVQLRLT